jgi:small subunit ribosomal protein S1
MMDNVAAENSRSNEIKPKMQFTGKVVKLGLAGAVLDIGTGQPAVIHISQLVSPNDEPIKRVEDVLQVGNEVEVWVKRVRQDHVELTMVKPLGLEWREIKPGMVVKGTIVRLEKFGAFVEIGAERPGLIHISEMAHTYVRTPADAVKEGEEVEAQVLEVDRRKKQIKLSLKALQPAPEAEAAPVRNETEERPARRSRRRKDEEEPQKPVETPQAAAVVADPTAMEMAMREAMERAKTKRRQEPHRHRTKLSTEEQEDLLARTLEHKSRTA